MEVFTDRKMRSPIAVAMLVFSLVSSGVIGTNFDDHERALERARVLKERTPPTKAEAKAIRSLVENGRFKVSKERPSKLPEVEAAEGFIQRTLKGRSLMTGKRGGPRNRGAATRTGRTTGTQLNGPRGLSHKPQSTGRDGFDLFFYDDDGSFVDDAIIDEFFPDDDFIGGAVDDIIFDGGLTYIFLGLEGFQDGRGLASAIVPNRALPNEFDAGAVYMLNEEPIFSVNSFGSVDDGIVGTINSNSTVNEGDQFASVTGKCTRTDPRDIFDPNYEGLAYCQYTYSFFDEEGVTQLNAEGPLKIGEPTVLAATGGTGIFRSIVGEIILTPVKVGALPALESDLSLDLPASYYMQASLNADISLIPLDFLEF